MLWCVCIISFYLFRPAADEGIIGGKRDFIMFFCRLDIKTNIIRFVGADKIVYFAQDFTQNSFFTCFFNEILRL